MSVMDFVLLLAVSIALEKSWSSFNVTLQVPANNLYTAEHMTACGKSCEDYFFSYICFQLFKAGLTKALKAGLTKALKALQQKPKNLKINEFCPIA